MPKYQIESSLTVRLKRTFLVDAENEEDAREAFEQDFDRLEMIAEETTKVIGDEEIDSVSIATVAA